DSGPHPEKTAGRRMIGTILLLVTTGGQVHKPHDSWTLQVGLAHSADDADHYAVSGLQGRLPFFVVDREDRSDRLGDVGVEIGLYPYPVISRAYVPGPDADPNTPGKLNFW